MRFPRIAVPTNDRIEVFAHTGRAEGFGIYEVRGESIRLIDYKVNPLEHHHHGHTHTASCSSGNCHHLPGQQHSHHSHSAILPLLRGCDALVVNRIGPHLKEELIKAGIPFFISGETFIEDAIRNYLNTSKTL